MRSALLTIYLTYVSLVVGAFFSNILRGLVQSGRYYNLINDLPPNVINDLISDENDAANFVCNILDGQPITELVSLGQDVATEVEADFAAITSFILNLPSLAPSILDDFEQGGEDVVGIVSELAAHPGAAVTVFFHGAESVVEDAWSDIEAVGSHIVSDIECFVSGCTTATVNDAASSAANILVNACHGRTMPASAAPSATSDSVASGIVAAPSSTASTPPFTSAATGIDSGLPSAFTTTTTSPSSKTTSTPVSTIAPNAANRSSDTTQVWLWMWPLAGLVSLMVWL